MHVAFTAKPVVVRKSKFSDNVAFNDGGALSLKNATANLLIEDSVFQFNVALDDAGHVQTETAGVVTLRRVQFVNGFSNDKGGALVLQNNVSTVDSCLFSNNTAGCFVPTRGGGGSIRSLVCSPCTRELMPAAGEIPRCFLPVRCTCVCVCVHVSVCVYV